MVTLLSGVFHLVNDGLEGSGVVEGEVGEHLAVDLDTSLMDEAHELAVGEILHAGSGVDTLDPERAEVALLVLAVAVSIGKTFFPGILGYGPYVLTAAEITAGEFQDFLTTCSGSNMVNRSWHCFERF